MKLGNGVSGLGIVYVRIVQIEGLNDNVYTFVAFLVTLVSYLHEVLKEFTCRGIVLTQASLVTAETEVR